MTNFDERALTWDEDPLKVERAGAVAKAIQRIIPLNPQMTALEYGCGTGLLSFALQSGLGPITLADTSQGMLDVLADKIKVEGAANMTPLRLDLSKESIPAESFDLVYSLMTLHHIPNTDGILRRFYTILKPDGWLCLADLDKEDGSFHDAGVTGIHNGFTRADLRTQAEAIGFTGITFSTVYHIQKVGKVFPVFLLVAKKEQNEN